MVNNPHTISVISAWQEYLERVYPDGTKMTNEQHRQTKLAFYAGYGACIVTFQDELAALPPNTLFHYLDALIAEIQNFHGTKPSDVRTKEQGEK